MLSRVVCGVCRTAIKPHRLPVRLFSSKERSEQQRFMERYASVLKFGRFTLAGMSGLVLIYFAKDVPRRMNSDMPAVRERTRRTSMFVASSFTFATLSAIVSSSVPVRKLLMRFPDRQLHKGSLLAFCVTSALFGSVLWNVVPDSVVARATTCLLHSVAAGHMVALCASPSVRRMLPVCGLLGVLTHGLASCEPEQLHSMVVLLPMLALNILLIASIFSARIPPTLALGQQLGWVSGQFVVTVYATNLLVLLSRDKLKINHSNMTTQSRTRPTTDAESNIHQTKVSTNNTESSMHQIRASNSKTYDATEHSALPTGTAESRTYPYDAPERQVHPTGVKAARTNVAKPRDSELME